MFSALAQLATKAKPKATFFLLPPHNRHFVLAT